MGRKWSFVSPQPILHPAFHEISNLWKHGKPGILFSWEVVKMSDWLETKDTQMARILAQEMGGVGFGHG